VLGCRATLRVATARAAEPRTAPVLAATLRPPAPAERPGRTARSRRGIARAAPRTSCSSSSRRGASRGAGIIGATKTNRSTATRSQTSGAVTRPNDLATTTRSVRSPIAFTTASAYSASRRPRTGDRAPPRRGLVREARPPPDARTSRRHRRRGSGRTSPSTLGDESFRRAHASMRARNVFAPPSADGSS
jgi:hypothetical protein